MLAGLEIKRQKLKEQLNVHHDRLTQCLPSEIVAEIFELCIPNDYMDLDLGRARSRFALCAPLVLSSVSRRWRDVACSTPRLWKTLLLYFPSPHSELYPTVSFIDEWIQRATQHPLSILLRITSHEAKPGNDVDSDSGSDSSRSEVQARNKEEDPAIPIIKLLNLYSHRWQELKFKGPTSLLRHLLIDDKNSPQLHTLHLENRNLFRPRPNLTSLQPRRLKSLQIAGNMLKSVVFDWSNLTKLNLDHCTLSECFEGLRRAPHLIECKFSCTRTTVLDPEDYTFPLPREPITQPALQELQIPAPYYKKIFPMLICPSLKSLALDLAGHKRVQVPSVIEFLRKSGCHLESFSFVNDASLSQTDITLICQEIPTLQSLFMRLYTSNASSVPPILYAHLSEFLDETIDGKRKPKYLPALQSFHVELGKLHELEPMLGIFGIPSRGSEGRRHRRTLEYMTICADIVSSSALNQSAFDRIGKETLKAILRLKEAGVKWKIRYGPDREDMIEPAIEHYGLSSLPSPAQNITI
ncbi:hypothetical protein BDN70DRAFT_995986 [Pholiota conissans]|uniref:F-box domain-containing protein n=1 Tax=Pholiota conissans TaxID=109636 RepID=A0A9P6CWU9_9AGAR|nr:hypothetical protein BDN70DRAFT_995986 [Pholiota conissans]